MGLLTLPIEILIAVTKELEPLSQFNLALACRDLEFLIRDDGICQHSLQVRCTALVCGFVDEDLTIL